MNPGDVLLWVAALALAGALAVFASPGRRGHAVAHWLYMVSALSITVASGLLLAFLLGKRFDIAYVFGYTSSDLAKLYVVSAFWAGPEGSFLLWALIGAWVGVALARSAGELAKPAMAFWCLAQGLLVAMLIARSPFAPAESVMTDGQGLNPILQDPWMAIHPPVLFLGFVAMTVPACLAAAALATRSFAEWVRMALPWTSLGWLTLGAGLTLGGIWAYEVLGWGGYWGWDPVENSSLVPWITGTILLHGLITERMKGTGTRSNVILAIISYLLVLYSTFLTRSGVLGDFSVHSFSDLGVSQLLAALVVLLVAVFVVVAASGLRFAPRGAIVERADGREAIYYVFMWAMAAIAVLVLAGTSAPLVTSIIRPDNPSGVTQHFYNSTTGPFALAALLLLALCPFIAWSARVVTPETAPVRARWLTPVVVLAVIAAVALVVILGPARGGLVAVGAVAAAAFAANLVWLARTSGLSGLLPSGAYLAHAGFALLFVGIAASNLGRSAGPLMLTAGGQYKTGLGWKVKLVRAEQISEKRVSAEFEMTPPDGPAMQTRLIGSQMPGGGYAFKPYIHRTPTKDIYFAPEQILPAGTSGQESKEIAALPDSTTLLPALIVGAAGTRSERASTRDGRFSVIVENISVEERAVKLSAKYEQEPQDTFVLTKGEVRKVGRFNVQFYGFGPMTTSEDGGTRVAVDLKVAPVAYGAPEEVAEQPPAVSGPGSAVLRVSEKPLMSVLWLGAALAGIGSCLSVVRRFRDRAASS